MKLNHCKLEKSQILVRMKSYIKCSIVHLFRFKIMKFSLQRYMRFNQYPQSFTDLYEALVCSGEELSVLVPLINQWRLSQRLTVHNQSGSLHDLLTLGVLQDIWKNSCGTGKNMSLLYIKFKKKVLYKHHFGEISIQNDLQSLKILRHNSFSSLMYEQKK